MGGLPGRARREGSRDRIGRSASPEEGQGASVKDDRFDPLKIVQALNHRGVEYVVIGGYAGELHAAAVPPTRDIDFTPRATAENLSRLSQALTDLDARIRTEGIPDGISSAVSRRHPPSFTPASAPRGCPTVSPSPTTLHHLQALAHGTSPASSVSSTSASSPAGQTAMRTWCARP